MCLQQIQKATFGNRQVKEKKFHHPSGNNKTRKASKVCPNCFIAIRWPFSQSDVWDTDEAVD